MFLHTGELDLDKLGGLRKQMPWAFGFFLGGSFHNRGAWLQRLCEQSVDPEAILEALSSSWLTMLLWLEDLFVFQELPTAAYITKTGG